MLPKADTVLGIIIKQEANSEENLKRIETLKSMKVILSRKGFDSENADVAT